MSYFSRKKRFELRSDFPVPPMNVIDLRNRQERRKLRPSKYFASYFETEHEEKDSIRFWQGLWHDWLKRWRLKKEQKYSERLAHLGGYHLDPHAQRLLLEIQKHRLHFSEHLDRESLRMVKHKFRELKKVVTTKAGSHIPSPQPERLRAQDSFEQEAHSLRHCKKEESPVFDRLPHPELFGGRIFAFAVWSFVLILPILIFGWLYPFIQSTKGQVLGASVEGVKRLESAGSSLIDADFESAQSDFAQAEQYFSRAEAGLEKFTFLFRLLPIQGDQGLAARSLAAAGRYVSKAGEEVNQAVAALSAVQLQTVDEQNEQGFTNTLVEANTHIAPAIEALQKAGDEILQVQAQDLPDEYRDVFTELQTGLPLFTQQLRNGLRFSEVLLQVLGHNNPKRYLVLFQNNQELRPTGGFIGSVAVMKIDRGVIRDLEIPEGGVYDISGQLMKKVIAPEPLHLVNPHWNLQDAGWFPDVPTSAEKIMWFYTESGGPTVDGIFFMTPEVVARLLEITGPVSLEERKMVVDKDNFLQLIAQEKEKVKDTSQPKAFIAELTPILLNQTLNKGRERAGDVLAAFEGLLAERDIMFFFRDESLQKLVRDSGWAGEMKDTDRDYFSLSHTNISGGKTDGLVEERVDHNSEIFPDGRIIDTVKVTRSHHGSPDDEQERIRNLTYLRFYVPEGSTLIEARGFSRVDPKLFLTPNEDATVDDDLRRVQGEVFIDEYSGTRVSREFGKTVFGNWAAVEVGESITVEIRYELPFQLKVGGFFDEHDRYSLFVQKQPGLMPFIFRTHVIVPPDWNVSWYGPASEAALIDNKFSFEGLLRSDWQGGIVVGMKSP